MIMKALGLVLAFSLGTAIAAQAQVQLAPNIQSQVQQPASEAQKRRQLLPHVRGATDCIANYVRQRSDLADGFQVGRMRSFISDAIPACSSLIQYLAYQHDGIYGNGTGSAFVSGPYNADLERAIHARVKPDIERQIALADRRRADERARAESAETDRRRRVAVLRETQTLLIESAYECTTNQLKRLISSNERAEIVTEAAITLCAKEVRAAIEATNNTMQADSPSFRSSFETDELLRNAMRKNIQATAVVLKADRNTGGGAERSETAKNNVANDDKIKTCLTTANSVFSKNISEKAELIRSMIDLCRPEIEERARSAFLANPAIKLEEARTQTLKQAAEFGDSIVGVRH